MADAQEFLKDFPLLKMKMNGKQIAYLDNGATTQKPEQIIHKMVEGRISKFYKERPFSKMQVIAIAFKIDRLCKISIIFHAL